MEDLEMLLFLGIMIPLIGTILGASMVFFFKDNMAIIIEKVLYGFASCVMIAASIWSLLLTAIDMSEKQGICSWIPASIGFILGMLMLMIINYYIGKLYDFSEEKYSGLKKIFMLVFAVTLHNIPE